MGPSLFLQSDKSNKFTMSRWRTFMSNFYIQKMENLEEEIQKLLEANNNKIVETLDSRIQLKNQQQTIVGFMEQVENRLKGEANPGEFLLAQLRQIRDYVNTEPSRVANTISGLQQGSDAVGACLGSIRGTKESMINHIKKENRITQSITDGTSEDVRRVGERPEKLRDIRNVQSKMDENKIDIAEEIAEENI